MPTATPNKMTYMRKTLRRSQVVATFLGLLSVVSMIGPTWWTSRQVLHSRSLHKRTRTFSDLPLKDIVIKDVRPANASYTNKSLATTEDSTTIRSTLLDLWQQVVQKQARRKPKKKKRTTKAKIIPSSRLYSWIQSVQQANVWQSNHSYSSSSNMPQVYLATHGSLDRWDVIQRQMSHWNGPVSVAIYISRGPAEIDQLVNILNSLEVDYPLKIHVVMEAQVTKYPHNILRDLALHSIPYGSYWFALDADFVPPRNAHPRLQAILMSYDEGRAVREDKTLLTFPALVMENNHTSDMLDEFPDTREQVLELVANGTLGPFKPESRSQNATNFTYWEQEENRLRSSKSKVSYDIGIGGPGYEPYVIGYRGDSVANDSLPHYWKAFRGWGRDKVSFNAELGLAGFTYRVLWDFFVVHIGGPPSSRNDLDLERNKAEWNQFFRPYLEKTYRPQEAPLISLLLYKTRDKKSTL